MATAFLFLKQSTITFIFSWIITVQVLKCYSFTPEDTAFAFERCRNISTTNRDLQAKWALWMFPDKKETHCFIKCFLHKLGLIDLISRGIDSTKIIDQMETNQISLNDDEDNFWENFGEELSSTCASYYQKWMMFIDRYPGVLAKVFYHSQKDVKRFYDKNPYGAKRKGMNAMDFCISSSSSDSDTEEGTFCYWECVFKHFRYFDAYGRVDRDEVISSFKSYGNNQIETIGACVHRSNRNYPYGSCQVSKELYKCLMSETDNASEVFVKRNAWTATY